jgi:hypothetical protein
MTRFSAIRASAILGTLLLAGLASALIATRAEGTAPRLDGELAQVRNKLEKYKDPVAAVRDGYLSTLGCVHYKSGAMGVHFLNPAFISPTPDPEKPQISSMSRKATAWSWSQPSGSFRSKPASRNGRPCSGGRSMARWRGTSR